MKKYERTIRTRFARSTIHFSLSAVFLLCLSMSSTVSASWAASPVERFLDRADAVVVGTMKNVNPANGTGTIEVSEVLMEKNDNKRKTVRAKFSDQKKGISSSASITFQNGDKRIWICGPKSDDGRYIFNHHPNQVLPVKQERSITKKIQKLQARKWNTHEKEGLSISVVLFRMGNDRDQNRQRFFVTLRNDSDQPLFVMNNTANCRPIGCTVENVRDRMDRCSVPDPCHQKKAKKGDASMKLDRDFVMLAPGEKTIIGKHGSLKVSTRGLKPGKGDKSPALRVRYIYTYKVDQQPDKGKIFKGSLKAPAVHLDLKKSE